MRHTWDKMAHQKTSGSFYGPIAGWGSYYTASTNHFSHRRKKMSGTAQESREKWKIMSWGVDGQEQNQDLVKEYFLLPVQGPWQEAPVKTSENLYTNRLCLLTPPNCWIGESLAIFPSIRVFSNESDLQVKGLELQLQHQSFQWIFRIDFL